ncbi:type IX secretion system membrane protein PorP/SprF [soil metagenome]
MKKTITLFALAFGSTLAIAQQDPQFSHYMNNKLFVNPAYAGIRKALCFSAIFRNQWNGFDGAPNSGIFSADLALPENGGVGLNVMFDKLGFEKNISFRGNYSRHFTLPNNGILAAGVEIGGFSKRVGPTGNQQWVATTNWQSDGTIPPLLKKTVLDMGLGLWYQDARKWFGISASHLNGKTIDDGTSMTGTFSHNLIYQMARHYYITGGANIYASPDWEIKPSFLLKTDASVASIEMSAIALYKKRFWFGASYRLMDAVIPMAGIIIPTSQTNPDLGLKLGFSYDYTTSELKNYNNGSFEVFLNYCIPYEWIYGNHFDVRSFW